MGQPRATARHPPPAEQPPPAARCRPRPAIPPLGTRLPPPLLPVPAFPCSCHSPPLSLLMHMDGRMRGRAASPPAAVG